MIEQSFDQTSINLYVNACAIVKQQPENLPVLETKQEPQRYQKPAYHYGKLFGVERSCKSAYLLCLFYVQVQFCRLKMYNDMVITVLCKFDRDYTSKWMSQLQRTVHEMQFI